MPRIADRLTQQRAESFVGRTAQMELIISALVGDAAAAPIWYIYGPAGIGKSALLGAIARRCATLGMPVWFVDARHAEPSREGLLALLREALGIETQQAPLAALGANPGRQVLMIDSFELLAPLTAWLSEVVFPELPEQVRVILAGRNHPPLDWQVDPGWRTVVRSVALPSLTPDESRALLAHRQIAPAHHDDLVTLARGHPLTLALAADLVAHHGTLPLSREPTPETITSVLERFIQATPSAAHRMALEVCALVRSTTEGLLGALLELPDCYELFEWLRGLACMEAGPNGLFPNDLVREALIADVRWRNRDRYITLHQRARRYYGELLQRTSPAEQQPILADYVFLHRRHPLVQPFYDWQAMSGLLLLPATPADWPALRALIARHEGEESAALADYWYRRQSAGVQVVWGAQGRAAPPQGLLFTLRLELAQEADRALDPAVAAAWQQIAQTGPLRPGDVALHFRFWMAAEHYQQVSPVQSLIFVEIVRAYLTTPSLACTLLPCHDPSFWAPLFQYARLQRMEAADFAVSGRHYGVYGLDWRVLPPFAWLEVLGSQEDRRADLPDQAITALILNATEFAAAARDALRTLSDPAKLAANPLLRSRRVIERAGPHADEQTRMRVLRALVDEACTLLAGERQRARHGAALTLLLRNPDLTYEQGAEALQIPFSTFRRYVRQGMTAVVDTLWRWERQEDAASLALYGLD